MFIPDQSQYWVDSKPDQVVYLSTSANRPIVIPPGQSPEPAQAYICILHTEKGYEIYIYLHLIHSNRGLLYRWDGGAVSKEQAFRLQENAFEFTGSMGFIMTDLRWKELKPDAKMELFNSIPLFFQDLTRFKDEVAEEVLEIEPTGEEELIVEPVKEELAESVTAGEFVIPEETFAEPAKEEKGIGDLPNLTEVEIPEKGKALTYSEEEVLLDQLEVKEEPEIISSSSAQLPQAPAKAVEQAIEEEIKIPLIEEAPPLRTGPGRVVEAQSVGSGEAEGEIEEVVINIESESEEKIEEEMKEQVEEVVLSGAMREEAVPKLNSKEKIGFPAKTEPSFAQEGEAVFSKVRESEIAQSLKETSSGIKGIKLSKEEFELLIRFLAMF